MTQHPFVGFVAASVASLVAHGIAYASLLLAPAPPRELPPSRVAFRVPEPAPPPPAPKAPEPPAPMEPPAHAAKPKAAPTFSPEPVLPPPPAVDLRGVTLTNDVGGAAWSSAVGNGQPLDGPVGPIGAVAPPRPSASARLALAALTNPEIPLVAAADLSSKPVPPELASDLRGRYPALAKQRGIGGSASVQARIEPSGAVRQVSVQSETFVGFGDACRQTLLGSRWSPPRDRDGRPVATLVRYTCRFVVQP